MLIDHSCPRCSGSLYDETYRAEDKYFYEVNCINCGKIWTPSTYGNIREMYRAMGRAKYGEYIHNMISRSLEAEKVKNPRLTI